MNRKDSSKSLITIVFIVISLAMLFFGCRKEPESIENMFICHDDFEWDSLSVANHLIGTWSFEFIGTGFRGVPKLYKNLKNLEIIFFTDGKYVFKNKEEEIEGLWELGIEDGSSYGISTNPVVSELSGRIMICKNRILFQDSYKDGYDKYFTKD